MSSKQDNDDMDIYDSDVDLFIDDNMQLNNAKKTQNQEFSYEVLGIQQIMKQMQECIELVKNVIHLPSTTIRTLLKHFKWDSQKLLEVLVDGDQEKLYKEVGIVYSEESLESTPQKRHRLKTRLESDSAKSANCNICCAEVDVKRLFGLNCGHLYCKECWNQYMTTKIMSEGNVNAITCAQTDCNVVVDDEQVVQLVSDNSVKAKYQRLTTNSYVESNRLLRWCPKPDCLHAFSVKSSEAHVVVCICGTQICFSCGQSNHEPIDCDLLREWNKMCAGNNSQRIDGKTANWIITNTKECPKCRTSIEKNGGCNHMTCRSIKCKYEFCWVCLESWTTHGTSYYNCNLYNHNKAIQMKSSHSEQRKRLEKFMFYWNRFMNHKQSLKFENELHSTVNTKMVQMQNQFQMAWVEVQFMEQAVDVLCSCRQILMYTYVFAYYNQKSQQLNIFEDNQRDLQKAVETLSQYLEQEIDKEEDQNIQSKVLDLSNYCENRKKALIDHIIEGNDREWWRYDFN